MKSAFLRAVLPGLIAGALLHSSVAFSQTPPSAASDSAQRAMAEALFFQGRGLMEANRYPEACVKFEESYRLDPAAGTLLNMGVCHANTGKIASAWGELRTSVTDAQRANRQDREALATEILTAIEADLPYLTVMVPAHCRVAGLRLSRNGTDLATAAWDSELPVDPGTVMVRATAPGYKPWTVTFEVGKREHKTLTVPPLQRNVAVEIPTERVWSPMRKTGFYVGLAGVASAIGGGAFGKLALDNKDKSDDLCPFYLGERRCNQAGTDAMSRARTYAVLSDVTLGLGVVGIGVGTYLYFRGGTIDRAIPRREARGPEATWALSVDVSSGGGSGVISGSF